MNRVCILFRWGCLGYKSRSLWFICYNLFYFVCRGKLEPVFSVGCNSFECNACFKCNAVIIGVKWFKTITSSPMSQIERKAKKIASLPPVVTTISSARYQCYLLYSNFQKLRSNSLHPVMGCKQVLFEENFSWHPLLAAV